MKSENQQQAQPTLDGEGGNQTRVTEVGGERSSTAPTMLSQIKLSGRCSGLYTNVLGQLHISAFDSLFKIAGNFP